MAGHNKWSKVKRLKGALDAKRGKIFSRFSKEITMAARAGGGDPAMNARLRSIVHMAKAQNMPNDNIDRAIKRGTGEIEGAQYEEMMYEAYGPGGVAIMVEMATDNKNRTAADLRSICNKNNGTLATTGSVSYLFTHQGEVVTGPTDRSEDDLLEIVLDLGAEEISQDGDTFQILTAPDCLYAVAEGLRENGVPVESQKLIYSPQTTVRIEDADLGTQLLRLIDTLEDYDDTLNVYANFEMEEELLQAANH
jgi:YebC/PmpR family DNA-binding regulatory protein